METCLVVVAVIGAPMKQQKRRRAHRRTDAAQKQSLILQLRALKRRMNHALHVFDNVGGDGAPRLLRANIAAAAPKVFVPDVHLQIAP